MMRVLLVEDEPLALARLARLTRQAEGVEVIGTATNGLDALTLIDRLQPDVVLLDIEMPGMDGMTVASRQAQGHGPEMVFVTAWDRYATAAFDVDAVDYLLKPVQAERLHLAITRAVRRRAERNALARKSDHVSPTTTLIHIPGPLGGVEVSTDDVIWIEAVRDYVLIHTAMRSHILRSTMSDMAERLPSSVVRVHRSAFANIACVSGVSRPDSGGVRIHLKDGPTLAVGPSYAKRLAQMLAARRGQRTDAGGTAPSAG